MLLTFISLLSSPSIPPRKNKTVICNTVINVSFFSKCLVVWGFLIIFAEK